MAYTIAPMGLLGMEVFQDQLTDKLFGDLILQGKLCMIADKSMAEIQDLFEIILSRIHEADLRLKPSKINLNVNSADTLGLHWEAGKLSPTPHKLNPLAQCEAPRTVKALRSIIGGIRFQEIFLPGP
jgi:hypothetical protein